ncbi:thermonuclease family protein [Acuticoccus sp.]|uniref:thermonuclease family protein n=1 Tax=Acuticoccus sp. TaxID=1904378 RepID=UPI003B51804E
MRRRSPRSLVLACLAALVLSATTLTASATGCEGPREPVTVVATAPGGLVLADGRTVRLAEVRLAAGAQDVLSRAVGAGAFFVPTLWEADVDRHGRVLGDIVLEDVVADDTPKSLRDGLLEAGLALVEPTVMSVPCLEPLSAAERVAEAAGRGMWQEPGLSAGSSDLLRHVGEGVVVSGTVRSVGGTRRTLYLNFGEDWATDFTVLVRRDGTGDWPADLATLEGEQVRVRGVLDAWKGGMIEVEHPAQVERLRERAPGQ